MELLGKVLFELLVGKNIIHPFHKTSLKLKINYLLHNCRFTLGSIYIFQLIGGRMEFQRTPFIAKLFLYYFYCEAASLSKKHTLQKVCIFSNNSWFINDMCTFHRNEFENNYNNIYPDQLELKKENEALCKFSFYDLSIEVHDGQLTTNYKLLENYV